MVNTKSRKVVTSETKEENTIAEGHCGSSKVMAMFYFLKK